MGGVSLLFLKDGKEVCWLGEGYADRENKITIARDTISRLYSMTKPCCGRSHAAGGERGIGAGYAGRRVSARLQNSRVWCGDHSEPAYRPILISDLLTMTSGLTYGDDDTVTELATRKLLAEAEERLKGDNPMTTLEFAERAGEIPPLLFQPGSSWKYGISADILGAVIEKAAHKPSGNSWSEKIFAPLGMKDTGFFVPEEKQRRLAKSV